MFDRYVIAQTKPSWKRRFLVIASVVLHAAAGAGLFVWTFFHVEEIVPPAMSLTVFSAPPPPPPPPPPAAHHKTPEHVTPKIIPHEIVQPTNVQKIVQPKEEEKKPEPDEKDDGEEGGEEGGVVGGVKGGVKGGVVGGVVGGTVGGNGTDLNAKPPAPKIVPQFMFDRERVNYPDPHLPEWFRQQHPKQVVKGMYRICVRTDGRISDVIPMTSIQGMDQTIIDQLKATWAYKPQPVPVCSPRVFMFQIN